MRILHIGKFFPPCPGGMENYLHDLMLRLGGRGIEQAAVVHHHEPGRPTTREGLEFDSGRQADVWRVRTSGRLLYAPVAPTFGGVLEQVARSFRPDIVHVQVPNTSAFWLLRSRALRAVPWIVQWQSDVLDEDAETLLKLAYRFYRPLERALLRRAALIVVATEPYLASSEALKPWREKSMVVPLGLDPRRLEQVAHAGSGCDFSSGASLRVLFVGRLSYYKGLGYLVEAVHRTGGVELVVAGTGDEREKVTALARRLGLDSRVRFAGAVSDAEKNRLMQQADVLCLPSISRHEAFGLVLVEAMGLGTPVIATRVNGSGMSWVVGGEGAGWLVEPRDSGALGRMLAELRDHRERLETAGQIARRRFHAVFDIGEVARKMTGVYESVLGRNPARGTEAA